MAKYIDQAGAQHFAEALMASTKTIGGQTIWGSGNIEAGGGTTIVTLTSAADFDTYKSVLESNDYKVVLFNFKSVDMPEKVIRINNATLISSGEIFQNNYNGSNIRNGTAIIFNNCRSGSRYSNPAKNGYPGLLLAFESTIHIQFINCHITFGPSLDADNDVYHAIFTNCGSVELYQSYIEFFGYSYEYSDTPDSLTLYDSIIKGFTFANDTSLDLNSSIHYGTKMEGYPYIANRIINCDLSGLTSMTMDGSSNNKVITNTLFECCKMPSIMNNGVVGICNVFGCLIPQAASVIYAAPGDVILSSNNDFSKCKDYLVCAFHKNVYLIEPQTGFNLANNDYEFNNCTLYTFDNGAAFSNYGTLKFNNCKTGGHIFGGGSFESKFCEFYFGGSGTVVFDACDMSITYHNGYTCIVSSGDVNIKNTLLTGSRNMEERTLLFDEIDQCLIEESCVISGFKIAPVMATDVYLSFALEPQYNESGITFTNCYFGSNFTFYAETNTYLEATQFINCHIDMLDNPVNQDGLFNVQRCYISSDASAYCHPFIYTDQPVNNTANGGFNRVM